MTGIVVMVNPPGIVAARRPSGAIWPPEGVSNSNVPLAPAVTAQPPEEVSVSMNDVWPWAGRLMEPVPICAPVSSRMITLTLAGWAATLAIARPVARSPVLSNRRM